MRRADFRKEGILNEANIQIIYDSKRKAINNLLKINSVEDFLSVFDSDQDGFLNEDEQIMVFTIIAKRIQIIAQELCDLKKYELFKDLMREVRAIENQINRYQNELRQNVHKKQLDDYVNIGKEMQNEFDYNWDKKMDDFDDKAQKDISNYEQCLKKEIDNYYQDEAAKINAMKLKQNYKIKLLQNQEKLVANNERIEEAINFRNELNYIQKRDEERLEKTKIDMLNNLNKKINTAEQKEMQKIIQHTNKERDKLTINRNKDIALALLNLSGRTLSLNSSMESLGNNKVNQKKNIIALKYMIKNMKLTKFDINSTLNSRKFCNVTGDAAIQNDNNLKRKIRKLIEQRQYKDEIMIPPSMYYDIYLENEIDAKRYRELIPKIQSG